VLLYVLVSRSLHGLYPSDPASYCPNSNLSFIWKFIVNTPSIYHTLRRIICFHRRNLDFDDITQQKRQWSKSISTPSWRWTPVSLQHLFSWSFSAPYLWLRSSSHLSTSPWISIRSLFVRSSLDRGSLLSSRSCNIHLGAHTSRTNIILFGVAYPKAPFSVFFLFILYSSNITNIGSPLGIVIHLYAANTQLYIYIYMWNFYWKRNLTDAKINNDKG